MEVARWHLGLDRSVIQDGTYQDFHRGQEAAFPVDVSCEVWQHVEGGATAAVRVEGCLYELVARVDAVLGEAWVLDCGLLVTARERPPGGVAAGQWLRGRARLGLGPRSQEPLVEGVAPANYTWFVERVFHRVAEDAGLADLGLGLGLDLAGLYGSPEEPGWDELAFTDAWGDDDGQAEYLLECLLVTGEAPSPEPLPE